MARAKAEEISIGVTDFKSRCLALIEDVAQGKQGRVVLLKRRKPVAAIVPLSNTLTELWGALKGTVKVAPGVDLTMGTGESWDAES